MRLFHKAVVDECSSGTEDLAIGYQLITMSMVGTTQAILVFKLLDLHRKDLFSPL